MYSLIVLLVSMSRRFGVDVALPLHLQHQTIYSAFAISTWAGRVRRWHRALSPKLYRRGPSGQVSPPHARLAWERMIIMHACAVLRVVRQISEVLLMIHEKCELVLQTIEDCFKHCHFVLIWLKCIIK